MRQPRLFISSSLADRSLTQKLADYLHRAYDEVWFDAHRYGGEVWWEDVLWNIKASDIFIYLLSPSSVSAAYCRAEYAEAQRLRKQILPVVIRLNTHVPPDLADLQPVDLSQGLTAAKVGEVLAALKQLENQFPKAPPLAASAERTPVPAVVHDQPRRFPRALLPALVFLALLVLVTLLVFARKDDSATSGSAATDPATDTIAAPTSTLVPATPTVEVLPTTAVPPTLTPTGTPTDRPTSTSTATPIPPTATLTETATSTDTASPTVPTSTNTSTVPPTVTRRYTATARR